jgi:hypothetical protein
MDRYQFTPIKKDTISGVRMLSSTYYPKIDAQDTDIYIITRAGDRLDNLAYSYYQDTTKWWVIATANNLGKGTFAVPAGVQLRIPMPINDLLNQLQNSQKQL